MTMKEVNERYCIPVKILKEYEKWGLCTVEENAAGAHQYDEQDIERLSMMMTLQDIGFNCEETKNYMRLLLKGENTQYERISMLAKKRGKTLDKIHFMEKQIANIDYLRYEMQKGREKNL